jgi:uncharacterized protein (TIGR04255 family)
MTTATSKAPASSAAGLPHFRDPPVSEVALSIQFDPLSRLQIHHFGLLWLEFQTRFPKVESRPPIDRQVETFPKEPVTQPQIAFELVNPFITPRVWFISANGSELLQVQQDRFIVNWRRVRPEDRYPRYPHIRRMLEDEFIIFAKFVAAQKLGNIVPNQCEVTYINQIQTGSVWERHSQVGRVLNVMAPEFNDESLPTPEQFRFSAQYLMGDSNAPIGRLHLDFHPAFRPVDRSPTFAMNLTARGKPLGDGFDGVAKFMDVARENIVRGFRALTTPAMHKEWGLDA